MPCCWWDWRRWLVYRRIRSARSVEPGEHGKIRILQTDCALEEVVSVEVIAGNDDQSLDDKDTRIWRVDFKPPVKVRAFETGVVPEGGEERVPRREPESPFLN